MDRNQKDIDQLVKCVVEAVQPLKIILFGSAARDNTTADSDVDILVVMPEGVHRRETARYLYKHLGETGIPVDILVATPDDLTRHKNNIGALIKLLPDGIRRIPELKEAMGLTDYAVLSRYPGDLEPVTEKDYEVS